MPDGDGATRATPSRRPSRQQPKQVAFSPRVIVQDFGKIKEAYIAPRGLTVLVGRNNTGKSYVATLLWAMSRLSQMLFSTDARQHRPAWFSQAFANELDKNAFHREITLSPEQCQDLIARVNGTFETVGARFLARIFAFDGFHGAKVRVEADRPTVTVHLRVDCPGDQEVPGQTMTMSLSRDGERWERLPISRSSIRWRDQVFYNLFRFIIFGSSRGGSTYVPAARTGLMLAYRAIVSQMFSEDPSQEGLEHRLILPQTVSLFMQNLV